LTGAFHRDRYDWRASQRHRLSHLVGNTTEEAEAFVLLDRRVGNESSSSGGLEVGTWKENDLIEKWMNVGLVKGVSVPSLSFSPDILYNPSDSFDSRYSRMSTTSYVTLPLLHLRPISRLTQTASIPLNNDQCGPGPTDEACRLDGGPQYPECPEYEPSCNQMLGEYAWVGEMSLEETLP
jgi:hypothetical protein